MQSAAGGLRIKTPISLGLWKLLDTLLPEYVHDLGPSWVSKQLVFDSCSAAWLGEFTLSRQLAFDPRVAEFSVSSARIVDVVGGRREESSDLPRKDAGSPVRETVFTPQKCRSG